MALTSLTLDHQKGTGLLLLIWSIRFNPKSSSSSKNHPMDASLHVEAKPSRRQMNRAIFEKEIVACDEALGELEKAVFDMKSKRIALNVKLNSTSPFLATLPLDVISEIFYLVNESQDREDFSQLPSPFLLGRICQAWREIVLSRPRLWSIIVIRLAHRHPKLQAQQELLGQWLENSGTHTLDYYIRCKKSLMPESVAEIILETSSRWGRFDCNSFLPQLLHIRSEAEDDITHAHSFSHLTRMCLDFGVRDESKIYCFGSESTPQLRCLQVHLPDGGLIRKFRVNWGQLSKLTAAVDLDSALDVLMSLNSIQHLSFANAIAFNYERSPSQFQTLPHLLSLEIIGNINFIRSILSSISTPALQKLSLCNQQYEPQRSWGNAILDLHNRAPLPLEFLTIKNLVMSEASFVALLQRFTFLSSLSLDGYSSQISDTMIRQLDPTEDSNPTLSVFLPELEKFTYSRGKIDFGAKTMIKMMEQRLLGSQNVGENKVKALRSIDIKYTNIEWSLKGDRANPNDLQDFYRDVVDLATRGSTLNLRWFGSR